MLTLCKCVDHRQWAFEHPLRQFGGRLSPEILDKLEGRKATLSRLKDMGQDEIGICMYMLGSSSLCMLVDMCSLYSGMPYKSCMHAPAEL